MSCPLSTDHLTQLKKFIEVCKTTPDILHLPDLQFFKDYIISIGGKIPSATKTQSPSEENIEEPAMEEEKNDSDPESDLELDMEGVVEPDKLDDSQFMGDINAEPSEENLEKADEKRSEAMKEFSEGHFEKAIELYTEAIKLNPISALLYAKRGQVYLKLTKPNACIKDCTRALELNCDSAAAYKFRGRAHRLLGDWEKAAADLRQACNIDFDEQTDEWLREVTPNARKLEQHKLKQERKKAEKELRERQERLRKAREANAKAAESAPEPDFQSAGPGGPGASNFNDFFEFLKDPEIMASFKDPEVAAAFQDLSQNPANVLKYQSNPKIAAVLKKLASKVPGMETNFAGSGPNGDDVGLD
ncbi:putative protein FAM10A4 [Chrysoperla carnea]|uniref:putative protein FAM10A4 n=1 Tax=Chrysoperla carnea TaxID=189513 RepID=UPI001D07733D|nr:putative protein FAM10A4 [Chrysoperla carnea]